MWIRVFVEPIFTHDKENRDMTSGKKFIARVQPLLLCLMVILLAACGSNGSSSGPTSANPTPAPPDKQVFVYPEYGIPDFGTLDPALVQSLPDYTAISMLSTGLVGLDAHLNVIGQMASSYQVASDGVTWTFKLKPNLKFSDGTQLTSADIAYSMDRALQPATKSAVSGYYMRYIKDAVKLNNGQIKTIIGDSILTPDPNTVVVIASQKIPFFLDTLVYPTSFVVEKSLVTKYGTSWTDHLTEGGSTGPFKVVEYTHNKQLVVVPNTNYYGRIPKIKVILPFYKVSDTTYQAYKVGQVEWTTIPSADYQQAKTGSDFHRVSQLTIYWYTMNYLAKPFDNIHIRQAFELALNKDEIVKTAYRSEYLPTNHFVPAGMYGYDSNLTGPAGATTAGDQNKAKQLFQQGLQEEGYTSVSQLPHITLTYASSGSQDYRNEVSIDVQSWQSVLGVTVSVNDIDFNKLITEQQSTIGNPKGLQFYAGPGWVADYPDPQDWLTLQFDKGASYNTMNYGQNNVSNAAQQQAIQKQLEQADLMFDKNARLQAYNNAEQQLVNDVAWLPIYQFVLNYLLKPCVVGFTLNGQQLTSPDDWANVFISTQTPCGSATT